MVDPDLSAEVILERWADIVDESGSSAHPSTAEAVAVRESLITQASAKWTFASTSKTCIEGWDGRIESCWGCAP